MRKISPVADVLLAGWSVERIGGGRMTRPCGAGAVVTVYMRADDVDGNLIERAMDILNTKTVSATFRAALASVVQEWDRRGPTVEEQLETIRQAVKKQDDALTKIQRTLGAAVFGGRARSAGGRK